MRKNIKIFVAILISIVLFGISEMFAMRTVLADDSGTIMEFSGKNSESSTNNWASTVKSYLCSTGNGDLMRVQAGASINGYLVEYYDQNFNLKSQKLIPEELPIFGAFYESSDNYFIVSGSANPATSADVEGYRITKYDKSWNRIGSAGLYNCNTKNPFEAGSCRLTQYGNYLLIRTCHKMYGDHQANVTIEYDIAGNEITDSYTGIFNISNGYISHSFNQFVKMDGSKMVTLDHGDAHPRSLVMCFYDSVENGTFLKGKSLANISYLEILKFPGETGANYTGTSIGGFEISSSSYLIAASTVMKKSDGSSLPAAGTCRDVYIGVVDRSTHAVKNVWLTDYAAGETQISIPKLVKISDDSFYVIWSQGNTVFYQKIDGAGNKVGQLYSFEAKMSDCQPIVYNGKIVWYFWNEVEKYFNTIDISNPSKADTIQRGVAVKSFTITMDSSEKYFYVGDTVKFNANIEPENATYKDVTWSVSNEEAFSIDSTGLVTVKKPGECTITCTLNDISGTTRTKNIKAYNKITKFEFNESPIRVDVGETKSLYLIVEPQENTVPEWFYTPSDMSDHAIYDRDAKTVTGVAPGYTYAIGVNHEDDTQVSCFIYVYGTHDAPTSLSVSSKNATKVVLNTVSGQEYSMDGETWQVSGTFSGLKPDTEYNFYTRKRASNYYHESAAYGPVTVKTDKQPVTSFSVTPTSITVKEEESYEITERILPENATDKTVNWTSSNEAVAKAVRGDDGKLRIVGVKYGETTLTGKTNDGSNKTATVKVKVLEKEHAYDEGTVLKAASCTNMGRVRYVCTVCGAVKDEDIPLLPHNEVKDQAKAATCETSGFTEGSHCSVCGLIITSQTEVPAKGHTEVVDEAVAPTCEAAGLTEGSHCSECGKILIAQTEIAPLGHDFTDWVDVSGNETEFKRKCNRCDIEQTESHRYDEGTIVDAPTCLKEGVRKYICLDCGREKKEMVEALGHLPVIDHYKAPGCEETGLTEGSHCERCGQVFTAQEIISATGHDWDEGVISKEPVGCGEDGIKVFTCKICSDTREEKITSEPHLMKHYAEIEATLTKAGTREYYQCDNCKRLFADNGGQTEIDPSKLDIYLFDHDGVQEYKGKWYYITDGVKDSSYTGIAYYAPVKKNYFFREGERVLKGWQTDDDGEWYYIDDKGIVKTGWFNSGTVWFLFDAEKCNMITGWKEIGGYKYYFAPSGAMKTGWLKEGDDWYYFASSGVMKTGWLQVGSLWYFFDDKGVMQTGWIQQGNIRYYFSGSGAMKIGWLKEGDDWYYFTSSGAMKTGWMKIDGSWYYFRQDGTMVTDEWIDGYYIGPDGVMR